MDLTKNFKKKITKPIRSTKPVKQPSGTDFKKLKLLITIVNRDKTEFYTDFLSGYESNFQTSILAQGTAKSETLYMLGLEDSDKSVLISVLREDKATEALEGLEDKFYSLKNGKGIAFTIPLSSVVGVATYRFLSNGRK